MTGGADHKIARGLFYVVLSVYALTSPGRIDIIDGQARYDVALHWLAEGRPAVGDPVLWWWGDLEGRHGLRYATYGLAGSVFSMPLILLGGLSSAPLGEAHRFFFSLTSSVFGALTAAVLYAFCRALGVRHARAVVVTLANAFATLIWPLSTSSFDNPQHAFFALSGLYLGFLSAKRRSRMLALCGGLVAGALVLYQEYFLLIIPVIGLVTFVDVPIRTPVHLLRSAFGHSGAERDACIRYSSFLAAVAIGLVLAMTYNDLRFGTWFSRDKVHFDPNFVIGHPISGVLTLLLSPGKSVFLYSPPLILGLWGFRRLYTRYPPLGFAVGGASVILLAFFSWIRFVGGDWCWGPRYLMAVLPLWALAAAALPPCLGRRGIAFVIVVLAIGVSVQGLALAVENQRFFFAHGLADHFWAHDRWFYFRYSALVDRWAEVTSLAEGPPITARWFHPIREPGFSTYAIIGPPPHMPRQQASTWMRQFQIFFLPRPWPVWMWWIDAPKRPINILGGLLVLTTLGMTGWMLVRNGFRAIPLDERG